jgi:uncharacterized membrane protein
MAAVHPAKRGLLHGPLRAADVCAAVSLIAALVAAALRIGAPYEHGVWLVAYLVLVGFAAQLLLSRGQSAVSAEPESGTASATRAVLWNLGVVAVPFGVLADSRLAVVCGGAALLAALVTYWRALYPGEGRVRRGSRTARSAYLALLLVMTASVFAGVALGWDRPWI